ncbi:MAG: hypothetical protein KC621_09765 [Myxococcales bacterium]|nr:hypothetical protein [Myxococcales bacterium]MCB9651238.1 hypothetical protein [Deltaproteobacteria bacterium]
MQRSPLVPPSHFTPRRWPLLVLASAALWTVPAPVDAQPFAQITGPLGTVAYDPATPGQITIDGMTYSLPSFLVPSADVSVEFRVTPARDILYARKSSAHPAASVCDPGAGRPDGNQIYLYRLGSPPDLPEILGGDCLGGPLERELTVAGDPASPVYTAHLASSPDPTGVVVDVLWIDLRAAQGSAKKSYHAVLGEISYAPDRSVALVQHDFDSTLGVTYTFVDLCPGRLGTPIGAPITTPQVPYGATLEVGTGGARWVHFTPQDGETTTYPVPACNTLLGLSVSAQARAVSHSGSLVDLEFSYAVGGGFSSAYVQGTLPSYLTVDSVPAEVTMNGRIFRADVSGTGAFTLRVDATGHYGYVCMGGPSGTSSPYSIRASYTYQDPSGHDVTVQASESGGKSCLKAVLLEVAKRGPGQIYETQPGELVLRYANTGELVVRDVVIEDAVTGHHDRFTWESEPGEGFTIDERDWAVFTVGDLAGGQGGEVGYWIRALCMASPEDNLLGSTTYRIGGDPAPTSGVDGYPPVTTEILPVSDDPPGVELRADADPRAAALGDEIELTLTVDNDVDEPRAMRTGFTTGRCLELLSITAGSAIRNNDSYLRWNVDVPARGAASTSFLVRRRACTDGVPALQEGEQPISVYYGCVQTPVDISPDPVVGNGGDEDAGVEPDAGTDAGEPTWTPPEGEREEGGGCFSSVMRPGPGGYAPWLLFGALAWWRRRARRDDSRS